MRNDLYLLLALYVVPTIIFLWKSYKASKSGSIVKVPTGYPGGFRYENRADENVPFTKTGWFRFWLLFTFFFVIMFILIGSDRWDLWFR